MKRSTQLGLLLGTVTVTAFAPSAAEAHVSQGAIGCVLVANAPTITADVLATNFAASGPGGGGLNTVHYDVVVDGVSHTGEFAFPGSTATSHVTLGSTAGPHVVKVFTQWAAGETRDGNSQPRTQVAYGNVTCPVAPPPPAPTIVASVAAPAATPAVDTPPPDVAPIVETAPVSVTVPSESPTPVARTTHTAPSKSAPKKPAARKKKRVPPKNHTVRKRHRAPSRSPRPSGRPSFTG